MDNNDTPIVPNGEIIVNMAVHEVVDFFGLEAKEIKITQDPKNPELFVWIASFVGVEKAITGPVSANLQPMEMKQQIAMSMLVGLHPLGEAISTFVYAQQIMGKIPASLAEATKAMVYLLISNLSKVYKNGLLQSKFQEEIALADIIRVVVSHKEDKNKKQQRRSH